jgi:hypothetical protein
MNNSHRESGNPDNFNNLQKIGEKSSGGWEEEEK